MTRPISFNSPSTQGVRKFVGRLIVIYENVIIEIRMHAGDLAVRSRARSGDRYDRQLLSPKFPVILSLFCEESKL
jgi:hypothetical protein